MDRKALESNPEDQVVNYGVGIILKALGKFDETIVSLHETAEIDPANISPKPSNMLMQPAVCLTTKTPPCSIL